jgi:putative CRISPR-associated protein (TIGR02620 family)
MNETVIVTRHAGLVAWLAQQGITGDVIAQATAADVRGRVAIGALPLHLAAEATEVVAVDLPGLTPAQRGQDLTPAEMDAAGATLTRYRVTRL